MHAIRIDFHRYKLNQVKCSCGLLRYFDRGNDATYKAKLHAKQHPGATVESYQNGELITEPKTAKPGRYNGSTYAGAQ